MKDDQEMRDEIEGQAMLKTEVVVKARRRQFSASERLRILRAAEACQGSGELGALLRKEGIYSSYLTTWRRQRERGELEGLAPQKRGPKTDRQALELARLQRENERLKEKLHQAEIIIEIQKKVSQLLGIPLKEVPQDGKD